MKKILSLSFILVCTFIFSLASSAKITTPVMSGTIGKYKIKMQLTFHADREDTVTGWYYYTSKGPNNKIKLSGTGILAFNDGETQVSLFEYVNGKNTGEFYGSFTYGALSNHDAFIYYGTWSGTTGKKLDFELEAYD